MTKAEAIDQIFIAVNGGKPTAESSVQKGEIENYLAAAIDYVQYEAAKERLMLDLKAKKNKIFSSMASKLDPSMYRTFELTPEEDKSRGEYYINVPEGMVKLPDNAGFNYLSPKKTGSRFVKCKRFDFDGVEHLMGDSTFYYFENFEGEDRVYIKNIETPVCDLLLSVSVGIAGLSDNSTLPISAGYEKIVIDLCVEFFKYQKGFPEDNKIDGVDAI